MANIPSTFLQGTASGQAAAAAASQAGVAADTNALFEGLLPMAWRSVHFPYVRTRLTLRQDLAIHKFVDRDGAHVEGTGRAPLQITARIPFLNGLDRGKWEEWERPLYPTQWRKFFAACADKSSGILEHPELGDITCKCENIDVDWDANVRSGVYVEATWLETDDDVLNFDLALASASPLANAQQAAADLDTQLTEIDPSKIPQPYTPPYTFTDLINAVRGAVDQVSIFEKESAGRLDNIIYQAQQLEDALDRAVNANALNWPFFQSAELAKSACYDLKATLLTKGRPIGLYTVPKDSTMSQIAANIGANVVDIMTLNRALVQQPIILKDAVVRYYTG